MGTLHMKILLIEDNKAEAHIFKHALEKIMDGTVDVCIRENFSGGIEFIDENWRDMLVAFVDLGLPDCDGWQEISQGLQPYAGKLPIIVVTGNDDRDIARELLKNGFEDYIVKGGHKRELATLRETVEFAICRHQATKRLSDNVDQDAQCIHWLSGGYSV